MKTQTKPIQIPDDIAARCVGSDQADKMDRLFRAVIATPHSAVIKDAKQRARNRAKKSKG